MRGKIRTSSHQTYFVFITLAYTKNSHKKMKEIKMKFDFSVVVARRFKSSRGTAV